ncbi:MAG: hypothetical protein IPJ00_15965 [Saprospirales bacterium]|nr:hypothetical protein [Saprospirales bacterium]
MDTIYFLTDVKNDNGIIIFSLAGLEFDQPNIIIATENNLKHRVGKNTMEIIYHLVIDDNKRDTVDIHIEEYGLEYKKFLIFGKLTRYWICKGWA